MTWSYLTPSSSGGTNKDIVRLIVGDTDSGDQLISDEEISYALFSEGSAHSAAAFIAEALAAQYSRAVSKAVGQLRISAEQKYEHYMILADRLRRRDAVFALPYAGGISETNKDTREDDTDLVEPAFKRGMLDNPSTLDAQELEEQP